MTTWYRMHDANPDGVHPIERSEARDWNRRGFGIFSTVNSFNGARRKENLAKINAWAVDLDEGTKQSMHAKLVASPLIPTLINETKRGYQAYWFAKDGKPEHWNAIVLERLVPHFGADKNARDLCRILRVAGFDHLKDPASPFRVRVVWQHVVSYTERQIAQAFAWVPDKAIQKTAHDEARRAADAEIRRRAKENAIAAGMSPSESLWDAIYELDCEEGLARLSGHAAVNGEQYSFRRTARGRLNIFVDGKGSACFVDEQKRIGSPSGGGPTLIQWLRWFGHDYKTAIDVVKQLFPRLVEIDEAARRARRAA